jgi:hypothetical protein
MWNVRRERMAGWSAATADETEVVEYRRQAEESDIHKNKLLLVLQQTRLFPPTRSPAIIPRIFDQGDATNDNF